MPGDARKGAVGSHLREDTVEFACQPRIRAWDGDYILGRP
ncbi:MAG: hypothetical protein KatS3mg053_1203 [Candidatus Roseilinea sp.]|nr:MAG: hypothetical protein KatS3mg053_1203 [Candidatus Roseilinea sp.]